MKANARTLGILLLRFVAVLRFALFSAVAMVAAGQLSAQTPVVPVTGTPPALTSVTINGSPGDQFDPHVSGDWAAYTDDIRIRYYNFVTGVDAAIPMGAAARDLLSDVSGSKIVFSRVTVGVGTAVMVFDAATPAVPPIEVDPSLAPTRLGAAIGGNTVAYIDFVLQGNGELVVSDLISHVSTRITNDTAFDQNPSVSPDGNVVVWEHCASLANCDIWRVVKTGASWSTSVVSETLGPEANPDSNGTLVVYDSDRGTGSDIFWRPVEGGAETQLQSPGFEGNPSFAGHFIAFESRATQFDAANIFVYDLVANKLYQITNTPLVTEQLNDITVLPDGSLRVVWASDEDGVDSRNIHAATFTLPGLPTTPLTITASDTTQVYGAVTPALGVSYSGFLNGDTLASLGGTLLCTTTATPASPVGSYPIICSGFTSTTYTITYAPGTLTITPTPLTIAANNVARPYGAGNPGLAGTITGLRNGDPITAVFITTAGPASFVGAYPITPTVFDPANRLSNYSLSLINGTLLVGQEPTSLTVTLSPLSIIVGQSSLATVTLTAPDMVIAIDPSVLAPMTLSSPVVSDILTNNGVCTPVPSAAPGVASCIIAVTSVEPNGRTLLASFPGTADLAASIGKGDLIVTSALEGQKSCISSDFRNVAVPGGSYLWFNSIFKVKDATKHKITITFFQSSVKFQYKDASNHVVTVNQAMPDARIVIDPSVTTASAAFDAVDNVWITTIPFDLDDAAFLTGMPWLVPAGGIPGDIEPVTWCGTFASDAARVDIGWRWAAAAYSSFSGNNAVLGVKPMFTDHDNPGTNHDLAGTPENFRQFVIPGARGRGWKNYTGTYSRSAIIE